MKLSLLALFASFAVAFSAKGKTYLVTFPNDTPQTEVDEAANEIEKSVRFELLCRFYCNFADFPWKTRVVSSVIDIVSFPS